MRIGINLLYLIPGVVGGTETYASGLLRGLRLIGGDDEIVVYVNRESSAWPLPDEGRFRRVVCPVAAVNRTQRYVYEQVRLPSLLRQYDVDLVHSLGYVGPVLAPVPAVVTIPDMNMRAFGTSMSVARRIGLETVTKAAARRAARIITLSEFSKAEIVHHLGVAAERIVVTPLAADPPKGRGGVRPGAETEPYIVAFSSGSPNKNVPALLRAYASAVRRRAIPHTLLLIGHVPRGLSVSTEIPDPAIAARVRFAGFVPEETRDALLAGASFLVVPSTYEGFGLPVLEAMATGVPVVCSKAASLPEVAGEAAVYFDPHSVESMADAIAETGSRPSLLDQLRRSGLERSAMFSWEATARATRGVYDSVLGRA